MVCSSWSAGGGGGGWGEEREKPGGIIDPPQLSPLCFPPKAVTCEISALLVRFASEELYQLLNVAWRQVRREPRRARRSAEPSDVKNLLIMFKQAAHNRCQALAASRRTPLI